ncbi:MAG: hypothetical protein ACTSYF_10045 [Promethearchaeota archaeon]
MAKVIITTMSVKKDAVKRRAKREKRYVIKREMVNPPPSKKPGRLKGSKNKREKTSPKKKKKRGKIGIFKVFDKGKKFYFKIDPYGKTVKLSRNLPASLSIALSVLIQLFALKIIQNNLIRHFFFRLVFLLDEISYQEDDIHSMLFLGNTHVSKKGL